MTPSWRNGARRVRADSRALIVSEVPAGGAVGLGAGHADGGVQREAVHVGDPVGFALQHQVEAGELTALHVEGEVRLLQPVDQEDAPSDRVVRVAAQARQALHRLLEQDP